MATWTFVTNYGSVLALIAQHGEITAREIASQLGITERSVHRIITDLEAEGYVRKRRVGRVNRYTVNHDLPLRRSDQRDTAVGELLKVLVSTGTGDESAPGADYQVRTRSGG